MTASTIVTCASMITGSRRAADMEQSTFISDTETMRYLTRGVQRLTAMLVNEFGESKRFRSQQTISVVSGTQTYNVPSDYYKTEFMRCTVNGVRQPLRRASDVDIDMEPSIYGANIGWNNADVVYQLRTTGSNKQIRFDPSPTSNYTVTHYYIYYSPILSLGTTAAAEFTSVSDTWDAEWGWDEWVELYAACKMLEKEESDTSHIEMKMQKIWDEIKVGGRDFIVDEAPKMKPFGFNPNNIKNAYPNRRYRWS